MFFILSSSFIFSSLKEAFWIWILPVQKASYTFSSPAMNSPKYLRRMDCSTFYSIYNTIPINPRRL